MLAGGCLSEFLAAERGGGPPATNVRIGLVSQQQIQPQTRLIGSLVAAEEVHLAAEDDGLIREILVDVGDLVAEGTIIAKLDDALFAAQITAAEAVVYSAQAALRAAQSESEQAVIDKQSISQAAANRAASRLDADRARSAAQSSQARVSQAEALVRESEATSRVIASPLGQTHDHRPIQRQRHRSSCRSRRLGQHWRCDHDPHLTATRS